MKEPQIPNKDKGLRIPNNTAFAFSILCLAGLTVALKQNGVQGSELFDHRFITVKLGTLTVFTSILKAYIDSKSNINSERTKKVRREVIAEGFIGATSVLSQYFFN